jgi:hypothetical protein
MDIEAQIIHKLSSVLSLPLAIARDAGNMKSFQFGKTRPHPSGKGTVGDFALHVQCPWRLVTNDRILTGSADYCEPAVEGEEVNLDDHRSGNLQRKRLREVFGAYDAKTRSLINETNVLIVTSVHSDRFGGLDLELSGGFRLQVFPNGSHGEDWRFFSPGNDEDHFVIEGGQEASSLAAQS